MNVKIPSSMKSPTVIVIGQGTMSGDDKMNKVHEKRMDNLERKLDQQYKTIIGKTDYIKVIEGMQSSFMSNFNKILSMNKSMMTQGHQEKIDLLRNEFSRKIKSLGEDKNEENIKLFSNKLSSLENSIKSITLKPAIIKVPNNNKALFNSFNGILQKLETLIRESKPRMYPSPS